MIFFSCAKHFRNYFHKESTLFNNVNTSSEQSPQRFLHLTHGMKSDGEILVG